MFESVDSRFVIDFVFIKELNFYISL